ncbi:hypothetical protein [Microtetraspora sp. NBRC 16547]|uniref:hypothetical protein n=1 Tax=Microtetraspora sp. NBRC 16547 TaxID=3030993 RepID=UPI0024A235F6|nr:hypothetical protein [Microtetraspora sp. NBRC 16547]GLW97614.1 hypothetical protein Misp02_17010 [Microtetraspora sp. NBRC 16547]
MNDTFEDRLLAELKTEMAIRPARAAAPRRMTGRRIFAAAGVLGLAAAAAVAVPMVVGTDTPAYALTKNADGSINLKIHEFRDPDQVERDLAGMGVTADITYLPLGKWCGNLRVTPVDGDHLSMSPEELASEDPAVTEKARKRLLSSISYKAIEMRNGITIHPEYIKPGQVAVIEVAENQVKPTDSPGVVWSVRGHLSAGPAKPCQVVDQPGAFEVGDATPPPGS